MNQYSHQQESKALEGQLVVLCENRGDDLLRYYLSHGFDALAVGLHLFDDTQRQLLFDYLMLDRKALLECLRKSKKFFVKMIAEGRGQFIRPLLGIQSKKYDALWREALDLLSLYFVEKKVIERMANTELEKFFNISIFGKKNVSDFEEDCE
jgi:tRNA(Ile)-lysidine synthase TilS/MesJ